MSATKDKRITLALGKPDDHVKWVDHVVKSEQIGDPNPGCYWTVFQIESIASKETAHRYISVSKEKTEIKDRNGKPMALYPLVFGDKKDAATFERIDDLTY